MDVGGAGPAPAACVRINDFDAGNDVRCTEIEEDVETAFGRPCGFGDFGDAPPAADKVARCYAVREFPGVKANFVTCSGRDAAYVRTGAVPEFVAFVRPCFVGMRWSRIEFSGEGCVGFWSRVRSAVNAVAACVVGVVAGGANGCVVGEEVDGRRGKRGGGGCGNREQGDEDWFGRIHFFVTRVEVGDVYRGVVIAGWPVDGTAKPKPIEAVGPVGREMEYLAVWIVVWRSAGSVGARGNGRVLVLGGAGGYGGMAPQDSRMTRRQGRRSAMAVAGGGGGSVAVAVVVVISLLDVVVTADAGALSWASSICTAR